MGHKSMYNRLEKKILSNTYVELFKNIRYVNWDIKACTIVYSRRYYQIIMSNYSKINGTYFSKNKYVDNQHK